MRDAKYLIAYVGPLSAYIAVYLAGPWSFLTVIISFLIIPSLEFFTPNSEANLTETQEAEKLGSGFFDFLLYLNVPLHLGLMVFYFYTITNFSFATYELVGMTMSVGIMAGSIGINVAHELGHRSKKLEQNMSKILLLTALYMHFFIEHNRGHHKNVATDLDPASAKKGETLYGFWIKSVIGGYLNAWKLEAERLKKNERSFWTWQNQMLQFQAIQVIYLLTVALIFNPITMLFAIAVAITGFLQLETVNYIEHYGLRRKKLDNGRYEKVLPRHSWNSNHEVGRIFLYELTRHSDHHYKASRKYQILRHMDESPQLPYGYPGSMIIAMFPPLWFKLMHKTLDKYTV